jgi:hypothetical protein
MDGTTLKAGVAAFALSEPFHAYYAEEGRPLLGEKGAPKIRCLVFDCRGTITALLNADLVGQWHRGFVAATEEALRRESGGRPLQLLFVPTHNHTGPFTPKPLRQFRKRHWLAQAMLQSITDVYREAYENRRPAWLRLGRGIVHSVSSNSDELDGTYDPDLHVLRVDDHEQNLIGVVVNFACHPTVGFDGNAEARSYLSADFPGVVEDVVQRIYGNVPVLFINGAAGDAHPAVRCVPFDRPQGPGSAYDAAYTALRWRDVERIGRIVGAEACKVLAELEAVGYQIGIRCDRWGYVRFEKPVPGLRVTEPAFIQRSCTVTLPRRAPDLAECERQLAELAAELRQTESRYRPPYPPNQKQKYLLGQAEIDRPLGKIMDLQARLDRWKRDRQYAQAGGLPPVQTKLIVLGMNRDVAALCFSNELHYETAEAIRARSSFPITLMFGYVAYPDVNDHGYLTTPSKLALGGYHAWTYDPSAEGIFIKAAVDLLAEVRENLA